MKSDIATLKAYCHWKRKEKELSEDDADFVKAIEDMISQVTTFKTERDNYRHEFKMLQAGAIRDRERVEKLEAALRDAKSR